MAGFCLCQINKRAKEEIADDFEIVEVVIQNNSSDSYFFNTCDIENPICNIQYKDDIFRIKEFDFSLSDEIASEIFIFPSSFSYRLDQFGEIKFNIKLDEKIDDYYKTVFNKDKGTFSTACIGKSLENHFYIYCSREIFGYSNYMDYCKKISKYGIKLEGTRTGEKIIKFVIE